MHSKTVTREELHEAIWQTPMNKLAAEWGVVIASIVRACNAMDVPRPGAGHWQAVAKGWVMEAKPLPAVTKRRPTSVTLKPAGKRMPVEIGVKLSEDLRELHPLIRALDKHSKKMPAIDSGKVSAEAAYKAGAWVSHKHLRRAILILDAVVKGLEERGATFVEKKEPTYPFHAKLPNGSVTFRLFEETKDVKELVKQTPCGIDGFICDYEVRRKPLDKLTFDIPQRYPKGARKKWHDSRTYQIEDKISEIVEQIVIMPTWERDSREAEEREREEAHQKFEEEATRRNAPDWLEDQVEGLKKHFEEKQQEWVKARAARDFLATCEGTMRAGRAAPLQEWQRQWLQWGKEWVDSIDPLTNGFLDELKTEFDEMKELEAYVAQLKREEPERFAKPAE
jgi:hypothetical protein